MYFRKYGLPKTWLDECLKSAVSEELSKTNLVNAPKYGSNYKKYSLTIFLDHS